MGATFLGTLSFTARHNHLAGGDAWRLAQAAFDFGQPHVWQHGPGFSLTNAHVV